MAKIKTYANDNTINANDKLIGTDFNDSDKTKNYLISELKNYILNGLDVRPYKVYAALLSQTGTNTPVATVLENTLGGTVVWSYIGTGLYLGTLVGAFPIEKTQLFLQNTGGHQANYYINDNNIDYVAIATSEIDTNVNGLLLNTPIEIRVYN